MECNHFSLLKTKGSASFSLALRSVSESRRLKVKLAVGSICGKKKKVSVLTYLSLNLHVM